MSKISILVAIYNSEKYLQRCIDSVLKQEYQDWELILVNDGSPDNSQVIAEEATKKDSRVQTIWKQNGGLATSRLTGYLNVTGEYIVFLDADDWLLPGALVKLHDSIEKDGGYDVVRSRVIRVDEEGRKTCEHHPIESGVMIGEGKYLSAIQSDLVCPYVHDAIYRASLFSKEVFLPLVENRISHGEDWFINYYIAPKVKRVKFLDEPTYAYYCNEDSILAGTVYGWSYYDKIEKTKHRVNQELGVKEDEVYQTSKALMDLRYFFFPEVPFSWRHFHKIQPWALRGLALQKNTDRVFYNPKYARFLSCPWAYYLYTHVFRLLFYVVKMRCKSRKVLE